MLSQLNRKKVFSLIMTLALVLMLSQLVFAGTIIDEKYKPLQTNMSKFIETAMAKNKVVGMSIALVDGDQIVWAQGFGYADLTQKVPAVPETIYEVGSISKMFTTAATMQLAEAGKMDIDQPLYKYLPEFSINSRFGNIDGITPRTIMYHHSGLPSDVFKGMWGEDAPNYDQLVYMIKDGYTAFPSNYIFSYSNLAFTLLGHSVSKVAGEDFVPYMDHALLGPLGMNRSSFTLRPEMQPYMSKGYSKGKEVAPIKLSVVPAGALLSNVLDLSQYIKMALAGGQLNGQQILRPETLKQMYTIQNTNVPLDFNTHLGLGCFIGSMKTSKVVFHGGDTIQFHSMLAFLPEEKLGVVVLTNSTSGVQVAQNAAFTALQQAYEMKTGTKIVALKLEEPKLSSLSKADLQKYVGFYSMDGGLLEVKAASNGLDINLMGTKLRLIPNANGNFSTRVMLLGLLPFKAPGLGALEFGFQNIENHDLLVVHQNGGSALLAEKVQIETIPDAWLKRVGSYQILNMGKEYPLIDDLRLEYNNGILQITAASPYYQEMGLATRLQMVLKPVSDTEAIIFGLGRNKGETLRVISTTEGEQILYSGYILQKANK